MKLKKYKDIIISGIYLFIHILFIIILVANLIAGNRVQDMNAIDLLSIITGGVILGLEIYFNLK